MSLPARALAGLVALLLAFACGWGAAIRYRNGVDAADALARSEAARETERLAARSTTRISDALTQDRLRSVAAARSAADRVRELADSTPAPAGCPSRGDDTRPAVGRLSDATLADLVRLAEDADAVADRLRACQRLAAPGG